MRAEHTLDPETQGAQLIAGHVARIVSRSPGGRGVQQEPPLWANAETAVAGYELPPVPMKIGVGREGGRSARQKARKAGKD